MYSLILALALVGGNPPADKADFDIVGEPIVQALSKEDFLLLPPKEPAVVIPPAPVIRPTKAPTYLYVAPATTQFYGVSGCATGRCPTPTGRYSKR